MTAPGPEEAQIGELGAGGLRLNLKFGAMVLVLLPVLIGLGIWQLHRAAEKAAHLLQMEGRRQAPPLSIDQFAAVPGEELDGRRVELRGTHDSQRIFLLDNRIFRGRVGYEVISLFLDQTGAAVLVDRGWLQAPPTRDRLPEVSTPDGAQSVAGEFYVPEDRRQLPLWPGAGWPRVIQALDVLEMGRLAGEREVFPYLVVLREGQPGVSEGDHARVNMLPERHQAYALQWFLMAFALVAVFVAGGTNTWELGRRKWRRNSTTREADDAND